MPHAQPPAVYQLAPSAMKLCTTVSNVVIQNIGGSVVRAQYDSPNDFCTEDATHYGRVLVHRCDPPLVVIRRKGQMPLCVSRKSLYAPIPSGHTLIDKPG